MSTLRRPPEASRGQKRWVHPSATADIFHRS
jgi:hypothetical protein